ncbi:MAG: cysteine synthase A [Erysipelotrichaceae bacterium]|nr:cysteine synthase A [Erysipelotrichaceae bacterium]
MIYQNIREMIGNTPVLRANNFEKLHGAKAKILVKLEGFNPAGSIKDRTGLNMILDAVASGKLKPGGTIIEPTSGNTGIALAAVAISLGYQVILTMPETMSVERRNMLKAYGARLVLTPGSEGMKGAINRANELALEIPNSFVPGQFENPANPQVHYEHTGPEIYDQTEGQVDIFVAGVGTGGTISGAGKYLKEKNPEIKVIAVEPQNSPVLSQKRAGAHKIQGIGAGFVPDTLDVKIYDQVIPVSNDDAFEYSRQFAKAEGIFVGISSGAALKAAIDLGCLEENKDKTIVVIAPDGGDRYFSTPLFENND